MNDYNPGDGWRELKPSEAFGSREYIKHNTADAVQVWIREETVPPLPTVPYTVIRVTLEEDGAKAEWVLQPYPDGWHWLENGQLVQFTDITSFEVLSEPRAVTAEAVLDAVREVRDIRLGYGGVLNNIGTEFGIES